MKKTFFLASVLLTGLSTAHDLTLPERCKGYTTLQVLNAEIPEVARIHLEKQLERVVDADQSIREVMATSTFAGQQMTPGLEALMALMQATDAAGTAFLKKVLSTFGWPSERRSNLGVFRNAWLLAQHADAEPALQACVLELMGQDRGHPTEKKYFAYLTDRVLISEGKLQEYGTQKTFDSDGKTVTMPLRDPERVNQRRAEVGLGPIEDDPTAP